MYPSRRRISRPSYALPRTSSSTLSSLTGRGLTRLTWISGAVCRKFAVSPVCPRSPEPIPTRSPVLHLIRGDGEGLPPAAARVHMEQRIEHAHEDARGRRRPKGHVVDQPAAASDHHTPIQIEERPPGAAGALHPEPGALQ